MHLVRQLVRWWFDRRFDEGRNYDAELENVSSNAEDGQFIDENQEILDMLRMIILFSQSVSFFRKLYLQWRKSGKNKDGTLDSETDK